MIVIEEKGNEIREKILDIDKYNIRRRGRRGDEIR